MKVKNIITRDNRDIGLVIQNMMKQDQEIRCNFSNATGINRDTIRLIMRDLDASNTRKLKRLIERHGWQNTIACGCGNIWTIIQHADHDICFQRRAYKALQRYGADLVQPWQMASLKDRILFNSGKPQKYGTQLIKNRDNKKWQPWRLLNDKKVNDYRDSVDLEPIEQYVTSFNKKHSIK